MRLAIISLIQSPYWEPLYRDLSRTPGLVVRVFHLQSRDSLRGWAERDCPYDAVHVPSWTPEFLYPVPVIGMIHPGLIRPLSRFSPGCLLIHGYSYLSHWSVIRWAIRNRVPYLVWGDSNDQKLGRTGVVAAAKRAWLRYCGRHAAAVLTIGTASDAFWNYYGVDPERRLRVPLAVDNESFSAEARRWRSQRAELRRSLGLPPHRLLLFVGRFAPQKNLASLLRAMNLLRERGGPPLSLALVGDGPERKRLDRLRRRLGLSNVCQFGFQPQQDLPRFYAAADALILPSTYEPWGLVVNEAMATGLPILLSTAAGCRPDLLEEGRNGLSFDASDVESIAACLKRFCDLSDEDLNRMSRRSSEIISGWTCNRTLNGLLDALQRVRQVTLAVGCPA